VLVGAHLIDLVAPHRSGLPPHRRGRITRWKERSGT
jgi:hypothetical protein